MITINHDTLNTVVATAKQRAASDPRWVRAIERAAIELANNPFIEISGDHLLIGSPSGNSYDVNGSCQCKAYLNGKQPCWHRSARQLIARCNEAQVKPAEQATETPAAKALREINELY
jgi:hypothetical protein